MALTQEQLDSQLLDSDMGRYDIVKRAIEWKILNKRNEEYKKLNSVEIIRKALEDILEGKATKEAIAELRKSQKVKEEKLEQEMAKL